MTFILRGQFHKLFEIHTLMMKIKSQINTGIEILTAKSFLFLLRYIYDNNKITL